jgi:NodT family efflux transporter outer membrane factor (OMF) lipoprotein
MKKISVAACVLLSACAVGPNYKAPVMAVPARYKTDPGWVKAVPSDATPKGEWWVAFGDPTLNALEAQVAVNNASLAADYAAYEQAVALAEEAKGGLFPQIGVTGSAARNDSTVQGYSAGAKSSGTFEGTASWTPDIWGKIRRQVEENTAAAQISAADLANARLSAEAALASDYIDLRAADETIALYQQSVAAYQKSLTIVQNQYAAGIVPQSDVLSAQTLLDGAQAALINLGASRAGYEHAIAVLTGHAPSEILIPAGPLMANVPVAPEAVPSELLQRRPDIAAAERNVAEQNAAIGVAVGAYYPDISLSALAGYSADPIGGLFSASNTLWSLGVSAVGTLFDGGEKGYAVKAARFGYVEALQNYRQTVLSAFQGVETDLSDLRVYGDETPVEERTVRDAQRAADIAMNEYEAGTVAYTAVVTAEVTALGDEQNAIVLKQNRLLAAVALYQDLGGGFEAGDLPGAGKILAGVPVLP